MSLSNRVYNNNYDYEDIDPGYISESALGSLCTVILSENLSPDEINDYLTCYGQITEESLQVITEKNIVRLDKKAKLNQAYKTGILQCAAEDGRKEYKKLRTLWKIEAKLFKKLEKIYHTKAMARAREAYKKVARSKSKFDLLAANRGNKKMPKMKKILGK